MSCPQMRTVEPTVLTAALADRTLGSSVNTEPLGFSINASKMMWRRDHVIPPRCYAAGQESHDSCRHYILEADDWTTRTGPLMAALVLVQSSLLPRQVAGYARPLGVLSPMATIATLRVAAQGRAVRPPGLESMIPATGTSRPLCGR